MKNVLILIALFFVVRYIARYLKQKPSQDTSGRTAPGAPEKEYKTQNADEEEMALDPVCGSYVTVSSLSVKDGDRREFFCSDKCRQKYIEGNKGR